MLQSDLISRVICRVRSSRIPIEFQGKAAWAARYPAILSATLALQADSHAEAVQVMAD